MLRIAELFQSVHGAVIPFLGVNRLRLPAELTSVVAYLYPDRVAAEDGDSANAATAFFVGVERFSGNAAFIVTNRHNVESHATVLRWNSMTGSPLFLETRENNWFYSIDPNVDLAIHRFDHASLGGSLMLSTSDFVTTQKMKHLDVRLGDDICMIGLHRDFNGKITNQPTARFGHLVQFPGDLIVDDRQRAQQFFLVQIPSLPGFSGSPAFLIQDEWEKDRENSRITMGGDARQIRLLCVNSGHLPQLAPTYLPGTKERNKYLDAEIGSGIATVVPAQKLSEIISAFLQRNSQNNSSISVSFGATA